MKILNADTAGLTGQRALEFTLNIQIKVEIGFEHCTLSRDNGLLPFSINLTDSLSLLQH